MPYLSVIRLVQKEMQHYQNGTSKTLPHKRIYPKDRILIFNVHPTLQCLITQIKEEVIKISLSIKKDKQNKQ